MKFTSTKANIATYLLHQCQEKLTALALELSIRKDNQHVGSGLGGNNFQMLSLLGMDHHLSTDPNESIRAKDNCFIWGSKFLLNNSIYNIRKELDKAFVNLKEHNKLTALMLMSPANIHETYLAYEDNFPILKDIFSGKRSGDFKDYSPTQQIIIAFIMCAKYAFELDNNIQTATKTVGETICTFAPEVILLAVRKYICIDRIVKHNLDENSSWKNMFATINRKIN